MMKLIKFIRLYFISGLVAISATDAFSENAGNFHPPVLSGAEYKSQMNPFAKSYTGQCTWYVYGRVKEVQNIDLSFTADQGRDAFKWNELLVSDYPRLSEPKPGAIAIWKHKTKSDFGHVAYIEHVYGDVIIYTEANFSVPGGYDGKLKHENRKIFEGNKGSNDGWGFIGYVLPASSHKIAEYAKAYSGKWEGTYTCGQGITGLNLDIANTDSSISAVFKFYPIPQNTKSKSGSFSMLGSSSADGSFNLKPNAWIERPSGYRMVEMQGKINDNHNEMTGSILGFGCTNFYMHRE